MRTEAIVLRRYGGPEELVLEQVPLAAPGPGEILLRHSAINVNFHDTYVRTGQYRTLDLPGIPGLDAVGVVEAIGPDVEDLAPGDRIAWISGAYGGYAARRVLRAGLAFRLPGGISDAQAAASLMKAFTVRMLVRDSHRVEPGQTVLIHAAAGGVSQLLCQWCKALGARVIGTVSSEAKAEVARACGADEIVFYRSEDFVARVNALTGGEGVAAVYDSVGRDTFAGSLRCLDYGGVLVNFGQSSGPVEPFRPSDLAVRSLSVTRPILFHKIRRPDQLRTYVQDTLDAFDRGVVRPIDPDTLPLSRAADAHRILEAGESRGGLVLVPDR
ncbi:quinone oxidoreductase family protein [Sphingosinicella microcystinivorans]|uniref:quinone oxidoreductase family protein n=1 Tax=Sphingosinicella microcystinivorans TaxID=335406 RepID=UPI0022F3B71B|nr:quinone oxidoreductase [Sphingosinicella microcystinivorans]WBX86267.1 quinone oxidoreductase [Sphingosinicella microcystinivorans]